ncbi:uncharacterized protein SETTUDRAFT_165508 [Exserohilum turcica Et28A]|uniref:Uncharacterized protein n=1 Tax=Exserohilum turcicum (strain 28A) TaxID=671987 RepID=R0I9C0_EXST2|nr:uncharacterized protein SETTUDRAFT_165508 [Exserohilum turcica Et28A]EOA81976.1 hypothetical protein SETTUDRAFT_165508 [Exserohilum turcica Et28A]
MSFSEADLTILAHGKSRGGVASYRATPFLWLNSLFAMYRKQPDFAARQRRLGGVEAA